MLDKEGKSTRLVLRRILRARNSQSVVCDDWLTVEEPLEIRLADEPIAVIMRTPQDDYELVAGFLLTEGLVCGGADIGAISYCSSAEPPNTQNVVEVHLAEGLNFDRDRLRRNFYASSSCGICGKASIDAIQFQAPRLDRHFQVTPQVLYGLAQKLRSDQTVFEQTGSLHAAGLFSSLGEVLGLREDVGRHNAVDKLVGSFLIRDESVPTDAVMLVSGRTSFEIVQKAWMAGVGMVVGVSAPSSLAVELAQRANMTLVGFLRGRGFNVYCGEERISGPY